MFIKESDMGDIRDKIETIAGYSGKGAVTEAANKLGVTSRTLHRALAEGPSDKLGEAIERELRHLELGGLNAAQMAHIERRKKDRVLLLARFQLCIDRMIERTETLPSEKQYQRGRTIGEAKALLNALADEDPVAYIEKRITDTVAFAMEQGI